MGLEAIRAVILFAAGDPGFRAELAERPVEALAPFELNLDDLMLLGTVRFSETGVTFEDGQLLEQLLGAGAGGDGFPGFGGGFGAPGWFNPPGGLGPTP
jgi:hypothetical protein